MKALIEGVFGEAELGVEGDAQRLQRCAGVREEAERALLDGEVERVVCGLCLGIVVEEEEEEGHVLSRRVQFKKSNWTKGMYHNFCINMWINRISVLDKKASPD